MQAYSIATDPGTRKTRIQTKLDAYRVKDLTANYNTFNLNKARTLDSVNSYLNTFADILSGRYREINKNGEKGGLRWNWHQRIVSFDKKLAEFQDTLQQAYESQTLTRNEVLQKTSQIQEMMDIAIKNNKYFKYNFNYTDYQQKAYSAYENLEQKISNQPRMLKPIFVRDFPLSKKSIKTRAKQRLEDITDSVHSKFNSALDFIDDFNYHIKQAVRETGYTLKHKIKKYAIKLPQLSQAVYSRLFL